MPTWFSEIITPQFAAGGWTPRPRKDTGRQVDHRVAEQDRRLGDDQRHDVRHDVAQADRGGRRSLHLQRRNVRLTSFLQRGAAQHSRDIRHVGDGQGDHGRPQPGAKHGRGQHGEQDPREREQYVQPGTDERVHEPAAPGRDHRQQGADHQRADDDGKRAEHG